MSPVGARGAPPSGAVPSRPAPLCWGVFWPEARVSAMGMGVALTRFSSKGASSRMPMTRDHTEQVPLAWPWEKEGVIWAREMAARHPPHTQVSAQGGDPTHTPESVDNDACV
jgi:hypothetical protein